MLSLIGFLMVWLSVTEGCRLTGHYKNSWVVSVRKADSKIVVCTGSLIAKNCIIAPLTCFQKSPGEGFFKGKQFEVVAGKNGRCKQKRKGVLVMGHPDTPYDRFRFNIAYLETEPFDFDLNNPPAMQLTGSEKFNLRFMRTVIDQKTNCHLLWYHTDNTGDDRQLNKLLDLQVKVMSRSECWHKYCPSGNRGCVPYMWGSESYSCATLLDKDWECESSSTGAPLVCNDTAVGMLKSCWTDKPLMVQLFNQDQFDGIDLYARIGSDAEEVEPDDETQSEPNFPQEERVNLFRAEQQQAV